MTKKLLGAALVGASMLAITTPAAAQRVDRIVAFGDSYADTGNVFAFGYANPQAQAVYPTGRFSGGTNYIDTLAQILGAPVENFAIGGALASQNNTLICYDAVYGAPLCGKGFQYEVDQFLNVGTQSTVFPTGAPTFDANDLVTISIGGNDARIYQQTGGTQANAAASGAGTAALAKVQIDRLVAAGAPTISFLAGDTGRLPEILADPTGAAIRSTFSNSFNTSMQSTLSGYAANGVMVHYLDLNRVLDNVLANPGAYGITNGSAASAYSCPAFPNTTCVISAGAGYMFYGDGLHLTSDGFRIVGRYVAAQLQAPLTLQASSDMNLLTATQWGRTLTSRMDGGAPRDGDDMTGMSFFVLGDTAARTVKAGANNDQFRATSVGATAGVEFGFGNGMAGLAVNYSRPKANFENDSGNVKGRSFQVGGYTSFGMGPLFAQGYAGYGWDKADITRMGVVEDMNAKPKGNHLVLGGKAGYLMPMAGMRIGPVVGLDYARAKVDGYTETGDDALALNVSSVSYKTLRGSAGIELRGDMGDNGVKFRPYGSLAVEKDFTGDSRGVLFSQTASPIIVNSFAFDDASKKIYGRFSAGFSAEITGGISAVADASTTLGKKQGAETSARAGFKFAF